MSESDEQKPELPDKDKFGKITRGALQVAGGTIPFMGGILSAAASAWSEHDQEKINRIFEHWLQMLFDEMKEKETTIIEIMKRVDLQDEEISKRVESIEYQSLLKKAFRDWAGAESEEKRDFIRNILSNAAASQLASDDVVRLFLDWLGTYSVMHFQVVGAIYNSEGITRGGIWRKIGKGAVSEASADADLYKLLIRDLSTGGIIRQHREMDYQGNFLPKRPTKRLKNTGPKPLTSAFDDEEGYELTELGKHFVHYAMTELSVRIEFQNSSTD